MLYDRKISFQSWEIGELERWSSEKNQEEAVKRNLKDVGV